MSQEDSGFLQINDVILDIPPSAIKVERRSVNNMWNTLRTQSSIKAKSGFSRIDIAMEIMFTDTPSKTRGGFRNGLHKLQALVAQLRVTPFCYVENRFIRSSVLGMEGVVSEGSKQNMALVMKQMRIEKSTETTNVVKVTLRFCWFNYLPYAKNFTFKKQIFSSEEVSDPIQSQAWKLLYRAELERNQYANNFALSGKCTMSFKEFATVQVKETSKLLNQREAFRDLRNYLHESRLGGNDNQDKLTGDIYRRLRKQLEEDESKFLTEKLVGSTTSMANAKDKKDEAKFLKQLQAILDQNIDVQKTTDYNVKIGEYAWTPVVNKNGSILKLPSDISAQRRVGKSSFSPNDSIVVERNRSLSLEDEGLILTDISISFENVLAMMPIIGHTYPTFQHIGSIDAVVTMSVLTTTQRAIRDLSSFYSATEEQSYRFRNVPQGQKNVTVINDIVNLCGLKEFIVDSMHISTVPGQPDTYAASIALLNNPISINTQEEISQGQQLTSKTDLRIGIAKVLEENIALRPDSFTVNPGLQEPTLLGAIFTAKGRNSEAVGLNLYELKAEHQKRRAELQAQGIDTRSTRFSAENKRISNYFVYKPKSPNTLQKKDAAFRALCEQYAQTMSQTFVDLVDVLQKHEFKLAYAAFDIPTRDTPADTPYAKLTGPVAELYSLTDNDLVGVEFLQKALLPVVKKNQRLAGEFGVTLEDIRNTATQVITNNDRHSEARLKQLREGRDGNSFLDNVGYDLAESRFIDNLSRVGDFINDHLLDWHTKTIKIIDNLLFSGQINNYPQFAEIQEALAAQALKNSSNAYPDFPLDKVVDLLEQDAKEGGNSQLVIKEALKQLEDLAKEGQLGLKNIGLSALIQPDFYLFNPVNDSIFSIIPREVLNSAAEAVKKVHTDDRVTSENNWVESIYKDKILGTAKAAKAQRDRAAPENLDSNFWKATDSRKEIQDILKGRRQKNAYFEADDLDLGDGDMEGLGCALSEHQTAYGPLEVAPITDKEDPQNVIANRRPASQTTMQASAHHAEAKHRLGISAIENLPHVAYLPAQKRDPNKTPVFNWPTGPEARRITSPMVPNPPGRAHPRIKENGAAKVRPHNGVDLSTDIGAGGSKGLPVYAAADGTVVSVKYSPTENAPGGEPPGGEGYSINIRHDGGWYTKYFHLEWDGFYQQMSDIFWGRSGTGTPNQRNHFDVIQGQRIGSIGSSGGISSGPHLHFETWRGSTSAKTGGQAINPIEVISGAFTKHQGPTVGLSPENESLMTKSLDQFEKDMHNGQSYSMLRAYPTFRLYFIESDLGERKRFGFDDFFSYSSVKDIQVIRNKKLAADLVTIQLTNVSGVLTNRKFKNDANSNKGRDKTGKIVKEDLTKKNLATENPIASLMLQPGIQIQLRLGYNSNPEELDKVFNGVITDITFLGSDDLIEITCQSFGIELVQSLHGDVKSFGGLLSSSGRTANILEELLASPEVVHFGRWEDGEAAQSFRGLLTTRWNAKPSPQDDNIFAPTGRGIRGLFDSTTKYILYNTTIWDTFQEMTLRHPGMITYPVPYEGRDGPRMTMFFGLPDQLYFARDPSPKEDSQVNNLKRIVKEANENLKNSRSSVNKVMDSNQVVDAEEIDTELKPTENNSSFSARKYWLSRTVKNLALNNGVIKPFRNYHLLTSTWNIIQNNITNAAHNTFNVVTLQYGDDNPDIDEDAGKVVIDDLETFTLKCDAALPDEEARELFAQYPNCVGVEMAKRYCVGLLFNSLKAGYRGNIVIMGNPKIKPYDVCYIFDEYTDMFGPIEVEQVVHIFNQEKGFITQITPSMMVHVNQLSTMSTSDVMGLVVEKAIGSTGMLAAGQISKRLPGAAAGAAAAAAIGAGAIQALKLAAKGAAIGTFGFSAIANAVFNQSELSIGGGITTNPFGMVGAFIFRKLLTRSQLEHPFRYSPLVKNGKPMIGGLPTRKVDGSFIHGFRKFFKEGLPGFKLLVDEFTDEYSPANLFGNTQGSFTDFLLGSEK